MTRVRRCVGAVVLTHNSSKDLLPCLIGLRAQRGVDLRVIVVDNGSRPDERVHMKAIFRKVFPAGHITGTIVRADPHVAAVFISNEVNSGYSAGNNLGARFADDLGCNSVLIINPDVRISDPDYLVSLVNFIIADPKTAVACSAVKNLEGAHENPMIEPTFLEEFLWPVNMVLGRLLSRKKVAMSLPDTPVEVEKVTGACFLIRTDFLRQIGFFDERVFLYCEESILYAQVREAGRRMIMDPRREALHAHRTDAKGDPLPRFRHWARSRGRFHAAYCRYGSFRRALLAGSRNLMLLLIWIRTVIKRVSSKAPQTGSGA